MKFGRARAILHVLATHPALARSEGRMSPLRVIWWWEARRVLFNLLLLAAGAVSIAIVVVCEIAVEHFQHVSAGPMPDPPLFAAVAAVAYALMANVCYTLGWMAELFIRPRWKDSTTPIGPRLFVLGTGFSIALTLLPGVLVIGVTTIGFIIGPTYWSSGD